MTRVAIIFLSVLSITACSSDNVQKTHYYLLNSPTLVEKKNNITRKVQPHLSVKLQALPKFLKQPNLVLQLSDYRLHYSHFHMWAQPLNIGIAQALHDDLISADNRFSYAVSSQINPSDTDDINIKITAFQATHQSQVLLSGHYTIENSMQKQKSIPINFKFTVELDNDGYSHAVEKMRKVITLLAQDISTNVTVKKLLKQN